MHAPYGLYRDTPPKFTSTFARHFHSRRQLKDQVLIADQVPVDLLLYITTDSWASPRLLKAWNGTAMAVFDASISRIPCGASCAD